MSRAAWYLVAFLALALCGCPPSEGEPLAAKLPRRAVEWEALQAPPCLDGMDRTRVPGGWLVAGSGCSRPALCFVPDPDGAWLKPAVEAPR